MNRFHAIVCDDHRTVRESLAEYLGAQPSVASVRTAADADEVIHLARRGADVLVLDLVLGYGESGLDVIEALKHLHIHVPILAMASDGNREAAVRAIILGARGYCPKSVCPQAFYDAVAEVASGDASIPDDLVVPLLRTLNEEWHSTQESATVFAQLTEREKLVLRLLSRGLSRTEIASRLKVSPNTVRTHLQHIMGKLGVRSQLAAAARGRQILATTSVPHYFK